MLTNRELLELAAKATGLFIPTPNELADPPETPVIFTLEGKEWNPLEDDGDALRLAVKLRLMVKVFSGQAIAEWEDDAGYYPVGEKYTNDPYAATRRAIVRAAAEIGRQM